jgi:hypothetical protein
MRHFITAICVGAISIACATEPEVLSASQSSAEAVLPGKADDYLSPTSREWMLSGTGQFTLDSASGALSSDEKQALAEELLSYRFKAYSHFVNEYVTDKTKKAENDGYGEFGGLVRDKSLDYLVMPVSDDAMTWEFIWSIDMGGPSDLLSRLDTYESDGDTVFDVSVPKLTEAKLKASQFPKHFDPESYVGDVEALAVSIAPVPASVDAYPEYNALFADGVLDVLILIGGDYNEKRYDLIAAEEIFDWLKKTYEHPATDYTQLTLDSPPFTRRIRTPQRSVEVRVTLLHPDIVEDNALDSLRAAIVDGFETHDIVIYDGHAGQNPGYSGISYHYEPRHAITANDLAALNLPEKYQLFVFNGCKTYNAYPDALYQSPAKTTKNLDIISTVSFSWLSMQPWTTTGLMNQLLSVPRSEHEPKTWIEILTTINKSNNYNVFYGVHGLDDNPRIDPYADRDALCTPCTYDGDCVGVGNRCVRYGWGSACAAKCTDDSGCPTGYQCADIADGFQVTGRQCLPATYSCN